MNSPDQPCQATPAGDLRQQILDSRVPKNEREWWASREIEKLERELANAKKECEELRSVNATGAERLRFVLGENSRLRAEVENGQLKKEIDQARRAWLGDDYGHLPLIEAMEKFRNDREAEFNKLESDYNQLVASDNMVKSQAESYKQSILNAHAAMDKSGIIMTREKSKQGLTPRIKSIIARKLEVDAENERWQLAFQEQYARAEELLEENVKLNGYADMHMKEKARADQLQFRIDSLEK
jgi:hypothetical protein